jgi:hypothetical protein
MHTGQDHDKPEVQKRDAADRDRETTNIGFRQQRDKEFSGLLTQMRSEKPQERWAAEQAILKSSLLSDPGVGHAGPSSLQRVSSAGKPAARDDSAGEAAISSTGRPERIDLSMARREPTSRPL